MTHVVAQVDLADVVDRAVTRVRRRAQGIAFDVATEPWVVVGDSSSLERAVTNLLDNAAKWSPADGTVTVRLADGVLVVDDQGTGVAEADRPHVFERFFRSEESRAMPGSGLGLAIVRQVVDRHGGRVEVSGGAGGRGAASSLWLPGVDGVASARRRAAAARPSTPTRPTPRRRRTHGDPAARAEAPGAAAVGRQRADDDAEVGRAVAADPAERAGVHPARRRLDLAR